MSAKSNIIKKMLSAKEVKGMKETIGSLSKFYPSKLARKIGYKNLLNYVKSLSKTKGMSTLKTLGLIGAGTAVVASWAPLAKKLGEHLGWKIEERRAGKKLR